MDDDKITSGILGLGGVPVPKSPDDPTTENDVDSIARRRARMREGAEESATPEEPDTRRSGATGIDMGAGGQGTDLSGE